MLAIIGLLAGFILCALVLYVVVVLLYLIGGILSFLYVMAVLIINHFAGIGPK